MATNQRAFTIRIGKYISVAVLAFLIIFVSLIVLSMHISSVHDKQAVQAAAADIKLPANFQLISSKYDNQHCLDVCAHTRLTYKAADGTKLSGDIVRAELQSLGYTYDHDRLAYIKTYKGKQVHIPNVGIPYELDVSL